MDFLGDPEYDGLTAEQLVKLVPEDSEHTFAFIADRIAPSHAEHPILVVDLYAEPGRTFRVIPSQTWAVENNLSVGNMDFREFADEVDDDGCFRGFSET